MAICSLGGFASGPISRSFADKVIRINGKRVNGVKPARMADGDAPCCDRRTLPGPPCRTALHGPASRTEFSSATPAVQGGWRDRQKAAASAIFNSSTLPGSSGGEPTEKRSGTVDRSSTKRGLNRFPSFHLFIGCGSIFLSRSLGPEDTRLPR